METRDTVGPRLHRLRFAEVLVDALEDLLHDLHKELIGHWRDMPSSADFNAWGALHPSLRPAEDLPQLTLLGPLRHALCELELPTLWRLDKAATACAHTSDMHLKLMKLDSWTVPPTSRPK